VQAEAFAGNFKVQGTRDGNIYMMEKPKRKRNTPLFREDNSSLSQGQNKRWYFYFSLDENQLEQLPEKLIRQATAIAMKCILEYELDVKSILI
jgi:hypothetical protein